MTKTTRSSSLLGVPTAKGWFSRWEVDSNNWFLTINDEKPYSVKNKSFRLRYMEKHFYLRIYFCTPTIVGGNVLQNRKTAKQILPVVFSLNVTEHFQANLDQIFSSMCILFHQNHSHWGIDRSVPMWPQLDPLVCTHTHTHVWHRSDGSCKLGWKTDSFDTGSFKLMYPQQWLNLTDYCPKILLPFFPWLGFTNRKNVLRFLRNSTAAYRYSQNYSLY